MRIFETEKLVIKSWCDNPEEGAVKQAVNVAELPFAVNHVVLLPDTHQGYGMPIGCVVGLQDMVSPNMVGVDIGCGMLAVKTSLTKITKEQLKQILGGSAEYKGGIRGNIPTGMKHRSEKADLSSLGDYEHLPIVSIEYESARKQAGTLGGGNHFIEIQKGDDGYIWFMLHSGSRNIGFKVANHYNKLAVSLNEKWHSKVDKKKELAFLPMNSEEGKLYMAEMNFCLKFALLNRQLMAEKIKEAFTEITDCSFEEAINIHHNYATIENHFKRTLIVHRKGATSAKNGELGIIPGSQGTASYIVRGKGNKDSLMSCSHGAGRKMSRTKAQNELSLEAEQKLLSDKGVLHTIRNKRDLDEAPNAYKDIDIVMDEQKDLVDILIKLEPLAVIKG